MKLHEIFDGLYEARRNPEQNPKLSPVEQLRKYKDDPDIFISFKTLPKVGINPSYNFPSPLGVYCYPLQDFWRLYAHQLEQGIMPNAFASDMRYINVIKYNGKGQKILRHITDYTQADFHSDVNKLRELGYDIDENEIKRISTSSPYSEFMQCIEMLTKHITGVTKNKASKKAIASNKILRQLGYAYWGKGSEGFFTSGAYIETVDRIDTSVKSIGGGNPMELLHQALESGQRLPSHQERIIMRDLDAAFGYARDVLANDPRWIAVKERENGRWPELEPAVLKADPAMIVQYASEFIQGRWPKAEPKIMRNLDVAIWYAKNVIKGRWHEAEPYIKQDAKSWNQYKNTFGIKE